MKFHQLHPGVRFRYRRTIFRKVSPLQAVSEEDDSPKLIARSAEVIPLDEDGQALPERLPKAFSGERVEAALGQFLASFELAATRIDPPLTESQRTQLERTLRAAGQDLVEQLALHG